MRIFRIAHRSQTDADRRSNVQPTVAQPSGESFATSKTEQKEETSQHPKPDKSTRDYSEYEPPKYQMGASGSLESVENKSQLQRVGKELKTCKTKVTKLRNRLVAADLESLPLEDIERKREEFEVRLQELTRVWHEKVSYMGPENGNKEAETARSTLNGYQTWLSDLKKIENIKRHIALETPKTSRKQPQVVLSTDDESEVDEFHQGDWSAKLKKVEKLSRSFKSQKSRKRKTVEFDSNPKTVFNEGVKGTSTPAPVHTAQGEQHSSDSDPVLQQIEQMKRAFELEKEELKRENARELDQIRRELENEKEKIQRELARHSSAPLHNSSPRTQTPRSNSFSKTKFLLD